MSLCKLSLVQFQFQCKLHRVVMIQQDQFQLLCKLDNQ